MEYESPYIIIKLSEKEDVITLSVDPDPGSGEGGGTGWGPFF